MRQLFKAAVVALASIAIAPAVSASTVTILDGRTSIAVTSAPVLTSIFDVVGAIGGTTVRPLGLPIFTFDITGGTAGASGAVIEHAGSGVVLGLGTTFATVNNFVVDTTVGEVRAQVNGTGEFASIFDLVERRNGWFRLDISETLATTLAGVFNNDALLGLEGERFGIARVWDLETADLSIAPVPLPAAGWMLIAGVGGLVLLRRRQKAA